MELIDCFHKSTNWYPLYIKILFQSAIFHVRWSESKIDINLTAQLWGVETNNQFYTEPEVVNVHIAKETIVVLELEYVGMTEV